MSVHQSVSTNFNAIHDYLSFTWAPQLMAAYRRLAAREKMTVKKYLESAEPLDFHQMALEDIPFDCDSKAVKGFNPISYLMPEFSETAAGYGMTLSQWSKEIDKPHVNDAGQIDIGRLDDLCFSELTNFLNTVSKEFFQLEHIKDLATQEAWEEVFVAIQRPSGMLGYRRSFDLWFNGYHIGIAASGASNGGCYLSFSGTGCALLDFQKVFEVIRVLPAIRITRLDIAVDFMNGEYSVDDFVEIYKDGGFAWNNVSPKWHMHSGGELQGREMIPNEGRTLNIGKRANGKMFRAYEKGRQMGDPGSKWVRGEVELRSKDREIPLYALQRPADYFAGAYPCLADVINSDEVVEVTRIQTRKKKVEITYSNLKGHAKTAYGALINVMRSSAQMSDKEIVETLIRPDCVPKSINAANEVTPYERPEVHFNESVFGVVYQQMLEEVQTKFSTLFRVLKNSKELSEVEIFNLITNNNSVTVTDKGQPCLS
ncbi:replication initiation factor domain-containing protein [Neptuniibacter pectenicola]|uniref:replication initiation factor domain-containing protein n=1 Tax=Neptuniibacter pectenicola TaxID=1806669 RepID=UPI00082B347C|nr:replication initiation factor domain-containing protein [Neptuniibacter pectenicola]